MRRNDYITEAIFELLQKAQHILHIKAVYKLTIKEDLNVI